MPSLSRHLVSSTKTGYTPNDKRRREDGQENGPDVSNESEETQQQQTNNNINSHTTPFIPTATQNPAVTEGLPSSQLHQNNINCDGLLPSGPVSDTPGLPRSRLTFEGVQYIPCEGVTRGMEAQTIAIFVADAFRAQSIKLMDRASKITNSTTTPLAVTSFLQQGDSLQQGDKKDIAPLHWGLLCRELDGGIILVSKDCSGHATSTTGRKEPLTKRPTQGCARCESCRKNVSNLRKQIKKVVESATATTTSTQENITTIASFPIKAQNEITKLRKEVVELKKFKSNAEKKEEKRALSDPKDIIKSAIQLVEDELAKEKGRRTDDEVPTKNEMWLMFTKHMLNVFLVDGNMRKVDHLQEIERWAIVMHARTSYRVYNEIAKVMRLPHISTVYKKGNEVVSTGSTRAFSLCTVTLSTLSKMADRKQLNDNQRLVVFAIDSANVNSGLQWDYVRNEMVGTCDGIAYQQLRQMFNAMASTSDEDGGEGDGGEDEETGRSTVGSILENIKLAKEHCVGKMTSVAPKTGLSDVVASADCEQFSGDVVMQMTHSLQQMVTNFNFKGAVVVFDAANPNWNAKRASVTHAVGEYLPDSLKSDYPDIDFDSLKQIEKDVMDDPFLWLADCMHFLKNSHTTLEKSSTRNAHRDLKYKNCPINLGMVETVWFATGGGQNQMHSTKLSVRTFRRDAKSRMDCTQTNRLFSNSVARMIDNAIADKDIVLGTFEKKELFIPLKYYVKHMNDLVDITNGRLGYYTPHNALEMQKKLLNILDWFSCWKKDNDKRIAKKERTEYNFLATITWECLQNLILGHVFMIQYYVIGKEYKIDPRTLNTDPVEHHFGNCRQFVGGSQHGLTVGAFTSADRKASLARGAGFSAVGNCKDSSKF